MRITARIVAVFVVISTAGTVSAAAGERFECLVEPFRAVEIASGLPGILEYVAVDRGDAVKEGDVLARLRAGVERATYDLTKARAEFAARRAQRNEELYRKQMISSHEKDQLETEAQLLQLELRQVEERLKRHTISSPINGVVVKRHHSAGEYVQDDAILELAQIDPLRVEVAVPVRLHGRIRTGMVADVEWEAPVLGSYKATVKVVDAVVDAASGTIGIRLELPNPGDKLPAGTKCWVTFPVEAAGDDGLPVARRNPGE